MWKTLSLFGFTMFIIYVKIDNFYKFVSNLKNCDELSEWNNLNLNLNFKV